MRVHIFAGPALAGLLLGVSSPLFAQSPAPAAAPAQAPAPAPAPAPAQPEGKKLFLTKTCVACHGRDGGKAILTYPNLAGQDAGYLLRQINEIASGERLSGKDERGYPRTQGMKDVMHLVSAEERKTIADWLGTLPAPVLKPTPEITPEMLAKGKALYEASECAACHGADGDQPQAEIPILAGQKANYLALQIKEIRDGVRKNGMAESMVSFAAKLNDEQAELVAAHLARIERKRP